jgi:hypothetical protein
MKEDIIRMAREARGYPAAPTDGSLWLFSESHLERFFHMAQATEREACAQMAEAFHRNQYDFTGDLELHEAIRARGQGLTHSGENE